VADIAEARADGDMASTSKAKDVLVSRYSQEKKLVKLERRKRKKLMLMIRHFEYFQ
jgi:hypothetical protein